MICNHHAGETELYRLTFPVFSRECQCVSTYAAIVAGETIPKLESYCAIVREAAKHPECLRSFASDLLVWDRYTLTDYSGPFLWVLRESGTTLLVPKKRGEPGYEGRLTVRGILRAFGDGDLWFWWDGRFLRAVSPEDANELVKEEEDPYGS